MIGAGVKELQKEYKAGENSTIQKVDAWLKTVYNYGQKYSARDTRSINADKVYSILQKIAGTSIAGNDLTDAIEDAAESAKTIYNSLQSQIESQTEYLQTLINERTSSMTDVLDDIDYYEPGDLGSDSASKIETKTGQILSIISNVGVVLAVIIIAIIGIKYMIASASERVDYKKELIPYVIGAVILFGITTFLKTLIAIGNTINSI